jgi:hypothetical protein
LEHFAEGHIPPDDRQELRKAAANVRYLAMVRDDRLPEIDRWIQTDGGRVSTAAVGVGSATGPVSSQTGDHGDDLAAE